MQINVLKSKIHRATVTEANLNYIGSITIDEALMEASGIYEYEKVAVVDVTNGARLETYGAAAHLMHKGDIVIIMAYTWIEHSETAGFIPKVIFPQEVTNKI